ncbi:hypothetical protein [Chryseobacterium gwangjuense]|uniref:hypothetical protein n=1 Tax=Chryseobacterium gwangjuense TaxID=1069980 RepID=UPI001E38B9D4|nr:hypothetical protein [Chryseobacterium gwangjuense]MCE3074672.1 hypothetical protein [Chryseobacterium gwangjuense]
MKNLIIFFFLSYSICKSQVKITLSYSKSDKNANISIYNGSNEDIIIPLDMKSFKPYHENQCSIADYEFPYPILGITLLVENNNEKLLGNIQNIEISDNDSFNNIKEEKRKINSKYLNSIKKWSNKNKIMDSNSAKINYYLYKNLVIIKSKQQITFSSIINFDNITNQKYIYYYYPIDWSKKNKLSLSICIDSNIYDFLTEKQKQKLKKYKFFTGKLESNKIELN